MLWEGRLKSSHPIMSDSSSLCCAYWTGINPTMTRSPIRAVSRTHWRMRRPPAERPGAKVPRGREDSARRLPEQGGGSPSKKRAGPKGPGLWRNSTPIASVMLSFAGVPQRRQDRTCNAVHKHRGFESLLRLQWGLSDIGSTGALQASRTGSTPVGSTNF